MITFRALGVAVAALLATMLSACAGNATPGVTIEMSEAGVARTLVARLPDTLIFSDRMGAAAVAFVPMRVDVDSQSILSRYQTGDVVYRAAEQKLFVFLSDGTTDPGDGLVLVGRTTDGIENLSSCSQDCPIRVTARHVEEREHGQ
jgi:hypothetical protein